ncbi:hypothetical protein JIR001_27870 [Polycladomyces abyssicola]|jgi:hypothetical protein|uniref:Uncharacterized protein n=1 Tax=Polycladomyces abyssicola TaxID=1125966 RepID=A0A8D5UIU1_9BACL|nr:hypothetical protein [Polycladomyces abyssicola]BCU83004.1 hypothetical protein JIR001_27870 [Polycladomyces abyssicola]
MKRWIVVWLVFFLGTPIVGTFILIIAYQLVLDSVRFYPFWLGESYLYLWFPAAAIATMTTHWGKRRPKGYSVLTIMLFVLVIVLGTADIMRQYGPVVRETVILKGYTANALVTDRHVYRVPYFPFDQVKVLEAVREERAVPVYLARDEGMILAFADPEYTGYTWTDRMVHLAVGLTALGAFVGYFAYVLSVWTRYVQITDEALVFHRWRSFTLLPYKEIIHIRIDENLKRVSVETEEVVHHWTAEPEVKEQLRQTAKKAGLIAHAQGRYSRPQQYREIRLADDAVVIMEDGEETRIPYLDVMEVYWDGAVRITASEEDVLITDERYVHRDWLEELTKRLKQAWQERGIGHSMEVSLEEGYVWLGSEETWESTTHH